jgi:hypothetical protein
MLWALQHAVQTGAPAREARLPSPLVDVNTCKQVVILSQLLQFLRQDR